MITYSSQLHNCCVCYHVIPLSYIEWRGQVGVDGTPVCVCSQDVAGAGDTTTVPGPLRIRRDPRDRTGAVVGARFLSARLRVWTRGLHPNDAGVGLRVAAGAY